MVDNQKSDPQEKKTDPVVPSEPVKPPGNGDTNKPTGGNEPTSQPKKPVWEKRLRGWLMVGFTGALAVYTAYLYSIAVRQTDLVKTYSDAANVSAQAALRGVAVAESSIAVSKSIAKNQEEFSKIETRAYLSVGTVEEFNFTVGKHMKAKIDLMNVGKTPAYDFRSVSTIKTGTGVYRDEINSLVVPHEHGRVIGSGQVAFIEADGAIFRQQDSVAIYTGNYVLFVYGKVLYVDKFGDNHQTRYCIFFRIRDKSFMAYENWNDAN